MTLRRGALFVVPLALALLAAFLLGGATHSAKRADAADFAPMHVLRGPTGDVTAVVVVTIKGREVPFIVDTGAAGSVIDLKAAEKLGFAPIGQSRPVRGVGGKARALPIVISGWSVGPVPLPKMRIDASNISKQAGAGT